MIRIALVDDHPLVRAGLRAYLTEQEGFQVVAEAQSGDDVIGLVTRGGLDLIVLDLSMPGCSGIEILGLIRTRARHLPVLVFSSYPAEIYSSTLLRFGANAYLDKACDPQEIVEAILRLCSAKATGEAAVAAPDDRFAGVDVDQESAHEMLGKREFQVFLRLASGESIAGIGKSLSLSTASVSVHRSRLVRKLGLRTNADLTRYALVHGFI